MSFRTGAVKDNPSGRRYTKDRMETQYFLNRFHVTVPQLEQLAGTSLSQGGDFADLYFEHTVYNDLLLRDHEVASGGFHIDYGGGIRVLKGDKTGYAYSENTEMPDMLCAARAAAQIAQANVMPDGHSYRIKGSGPCHRQDTYYHAGKMWSDSEAPAFIPILKKLESMILTRDSRAVKVIARLAWSESDIMMYNSFGELTCDFRPMGSIVVSVIFSENGQNENKTSSRSFRTGAEMITDKLLEEMAEEAVSGIDARFQAVRPKGGKMPVVMGAGASGILLHEAMGHAFEADFNRKGQSVFAGMIGKQVCNPSISIVDDGTLPGNRGACNYDDEGVPGQKTYMVRDGVLESYLHDRISARWYGVPPTGNGRRESFRFNPIPRMRATYMENGEATKDDIIASVRKGIYVDEFSNGQVKIGEGDFTFYVKSGFMIENGRLTAPVKDINIIGNGPQALADITAVADDLRVDNGTWTCGKDQNVPVSCGIPTVLVRSLTVGGE